MVAIVNSNSSLRHTFHYNENKVKDGVAECIMAGNYPMDLTDLEQIHRLNMLLKIGARSDTVDRNCLHITLNFAPGEHIDGEIQKQIVSEYMDLIGFGEQPYLVYRHHDAGHPHLHIVTTKVKHDGTAIDTYNIGRNQSSKARKLLEAKYNLVRAQKHAGELFKEMKFNEPVSAFVQLLKAAEIKYRRQKDAGWEGKIDYGKMETKKSIKDVLDKVIDAYSYSSIEQLNAVLGLYNVYADRGNPGSRLNACGGLIYHVVDPQGKTVGKPIKASSFYSKPTLKNLQEKFKAVADSSDHFFFIRNAVDKTLLSTPGITLQQLKQKLRKRGIALVERRGKDNVLFGVTYVDLEHKCVVNGRDLGLKYAANGLQERLRKEDSVQISAPSNPRLKAGEVTFSEPENVLPRTAGDPNSSYEKGFMELLTQYEYTSDYVPHHLKKKKKKKKKK